MATQQRQAVLRDVVEARRPARRGSAAPADWRRRTSHDYPRRAQHHTHAGAKNDGHIQRHNWPKQHAPQTAGHAPKTVGHAPQQAGHAPLAPAHNPVPAPPHPTYTAPIMDESAQAAPTTGLALPQGLFSRGQSMAGLPQNGAPAHQPQGAPAPGDPAAVARLQPRSKTLTLVLCVFLGIFGVHRFYTDHFVLGIVYLLTFGFWGLGVLVDIILIAAGLYKDAHGRPLV